MIIKALNGNRLEKYGYSDELEYNNKNFNGYQIGISIGVTDRTASVITDNYISESQGSLEERNKIFNSIINDSSIIKIEKPITTIEDGKLIAKTIWLLPYAVKDHTIFRETVNFDNISAANNVSNHVILELLFVEDNLNRYTTISYDTRNESIMDYVYNIFEYPEYCNIATYNADGEEGPGYYLDFYDEAGERFTLCFETLERLRDALVSVRLLEVNTIIEDD